MKHSIIYIAFIAFFLHSGFLFGQDPVETTKGPLPPLVVQSTWTGETINLSWVATSPELWEAGFKKGYSVSRELLFLIPQEEPWKEGILVFDTLAAPENLDFFPTSIEASKGDSAWFGRALGMGDGFGEVIVKYFGDSINPLDFDGELSKENIRNYRFQHAQYTAQYFPEFSAGIGQGIEDVYLDTLKENSFVICRYTISMLDTTGVSVTIDQTPHTNARTNKNVKGLSFENNLVTFKRVVDPPRDLDNMRAISRAYGDSIVVRWAAFSGKTWMKGLDQGYQIVKYEIPDVDMAVVSEDPNFDYSILRGTPIDTNYVSIWDSSKFELYKDIDSMVLIAAMTVFGDFKKGARNQKEYADNLQNKYGYGLYAAELSRNAADAMGIRFVDYKVEKGKKYRYKVSFVDRKKSTTSASTEVKNEFTPLPKPFGFETGSGEYVIALQLDRFPNEEAFSFYFFERSDDGGSTWNPVNKKPISFTFDEETDATADIFVISDSVPELYKKYEYRVRAMNSFNEFTDWALATGMAVDLTPPNPPIILEPQQVGATTASISWEPVSELAFPDLAGYIVKLSGTNPETAKPISDLIPKGNNSFLYTEEFKMSKPYFFSVVSVDTAGNEASSVPIKLNIIDSIPPVPPTGLVGKIDTNGYVTLFWPHNTEEDLYGYRVYFANDSTAEFTQLTKTDIQFNYFNDTIPLESLTEEVYYQVQAVDARYNMSDYSEIVTVKRPDIIPPAAPILMQPVPSDEGIILEWRPSSSTDVVYHNVYRRLKNNEDTTWILIDSIAPVETSYTDGSGEYEVAYEYTLDAKDDAGWYSDRSLPLSSRRFFPTDIEGVSAITAAVDTEGAKILLNWTFGGTDVEFLKTKKYRFVLYRGEGTGPLKRYQQLTNPEPRFEDGNVKPDIIYRYSVGIVFDDGKKSSLSPEAFARIKSK